MSSSLSSTGSRQKIWGGGNRPLNASYGKMMMWFFIVSDALTFQDLLFHMALRDLNMQILGLLQTRYLLTCHSFMAKNYQ